MSSSRFQEADAEIHNFYPPNMPVEGIASGGRELCLEHLEALGLTCVAGCVGVGNQANTTVADLAKDATRDVIGLTDNSRQFIAGPHPTIENGIGIWVHPQG